MEVVRHQRPGKTFNLHFLQQGLKAANKVVPVVIIDKDITTLDSANDDVVQNIRSVETS